VFTRNKTESPRRERDDLVSHILLAEGDVPDGELTVTWVDVAPGSAQRPHGHGPKQVYVVAERRGWMRVGDAERLAAAGDLFYMPSGTTHSISNISDRLLTYVSAATPNTDWRALYDKSPLRARSGDESERAGA
jgi:mannose-6-phosphate isomerase-like protein (cupin superfamily)